MGDGIAGIADRIRDVEFAGIPLGEAALGGGSALVLSELTDGLLVPRLPTVPVAAVKGAEAYAMSRWGHKAIGVGGARVGTLFLTYEAIRALVPMENWIKDAVAKVTGAVGGGGSTLAGSTTTSSGGNGHHASDGMDLMRQALVVGGGA